MKAEIYSCWPLISLYGPNLGDVIGRVSKKIGAGESEIRASPDGALGHREGYSLLSASAVRKEYPSLPCVLSCLVFPFLKGFCKDKANMASINVNDYETEWDIPVNSL